MKASLRNSYITRGFRCRNVQLAAGNFEEKSIPNGPKHPHDVKAFGSSPLAACSSDGSRGAEVDSEAYRREALPPLRGFGRVAAVGSFPERTGCAGFVIISRNPHLALFLLWEQPQLDRTLTMRSLALGSIIVFWTKPM